MDLGIYRPLNFEELVKEEFGKEYNVTLGRGVCGPKCTITHKKNSAWRELNGNSYAYTLVLKGGVKIELKDAFKNDFNRHSKWHENYRNFALRLEKMTTGVAQKVSRIENILMSDKNA